MTTTTSQSNEPCLALPTGTLLAIAVAVPALLGAAWWLGAGLIGRPEAASAGVAGAAVTATATLLGTLVMTPWITRPIGLWTSIWMAGTVVRLLLAPLGTILLYSATPLDATSLAIAVGATYLVTLLTEAGVLARFIDRALPMASERPDPYESAEP
ncbi:MAG: hypothetical protein ACYTGC_03155 [Planctomycetota bacterium]